jgi:hypothetical protein
MEFLHSPCTLIVHTLLNYCIHAARASTIPQQNLTGPLASKQAYFIRLLYRIFVFNK